LKHSSSFKYCHSNKSLISACDRSSASLFFSGYLYYYFKSIFSWQLYLAQQNNFFFSFLFFFLFSSFYFDAAVFWMGKWSLFDWLKMKRKKMEMICLGERETNDANKNYKKKKRWSIFLALWCGHSPIEGCLPHQLNGYDLANVSRWRLIFNSSKCTAGVGYC